MNKLPWWAQLGLVVVAVIGTVAVEYFKTERAINADSSETDDSKQAYAERKRVRPNRASKQAH